MFLYDLQSALDLLFDSIFRNMALIILQVRFELTFFALNPELSVVAPGREWDIRGREDAIEYAKKHNVPVPVTKKSIYSRDKNLWHLSHEDLGIKEIV
ncbi:PREDICTED: argininosuccinate synthase, chloroplastic-like isoform X1 [Ipomoea nil]|uniref:argininosuccinate synthase, chloroplastic-like isoform X1 n=1 Tax=Ipomoea nil TaxID=35883 RepID=UPI00090190FA|nr:PREDICTED: argininosuccinate synthase, chloroplastic-like isoform X1 [Ipomoea nil]